MDKHVETASSMIGSQLGIISRHSSVGKPTKGESEQARQFAERFQSFLNACKKTHESLKPDDNFNSKILNQIDSIHDRQDEVYLGIHKYQSEM